MAGEHRSFEVSTAELADLWAFSGHARRKVTEANQRAKDAREGNEEGGAKRRLAEAKATQAELELAERLGAVVDAETVEKDWADHIAKARARLLAIPTRAAPLVVNEDVSGAHAILTDLIYEALDELARDDDDDDDE
jgi:phage terminase Nu1 subunit (DNA packaging protein)